MKKPAPIFCEIALSNLRESKTNPRRTVEGEALRELADSIRQKGVLQPLVVRQVKGAVHEIVAGHRRFRAAQLAGIEAVPVIVRDLTDEEALEVQVIENAQREDVPPLEEADAFAKLVKGGRWDAQSLAEKIGKPRAYVLGRIALSGLTPEWREAVEDGRATLGHARLVARLTPALQAKALKECSTYYGGFPPLASFARIVKRVAEADLEGILWLDDATLLPKVGACTNCPKRSGNGLFESEEGSRCFDVDCFEKKEAVYRARRIEEAQAQHPGALLAVNQWNPPKGKVGSDILRNHRIHVEPGPDTVAIVVAEPISIWRDGEWFELGPGDVIHVRKQNLKKNGQHVDAIEARAAREAEEKRQREAEERFRAALSDLLFERAGSMSALTARMDKILRLLAEACYVDVWSEHQKLVKKVLGVAKDKVIDWHALSEDELLKGILALTVARERKCDSWGTTRTPQRMLALAALYGIDVDALRAQTAEPSAAKASKKKGGKA